MDDEKKAPPANKFVEAPVEQPAKPKRRYKYIGGKYRTGVYLPDLVTKIKPDLCTDEQIDAYLKRFPKLLGQLWQEIK